MNFLSPDWPVLKEYDPDHLARIALPLGGIGTGTVSLGGRGDLRDWEVMNRPAKGFAPPMSGRGGAPFFALYARAEGGKAVTRCLEGPLETFEYEGDFGSRAPNHGLPRFRECRFATAYPFGQVLLSDPDLPVRARIEAFNPLVPADAQASGIPVAVLRYVLENVTDTPVAASVCGSVPNFVGRDGTNGREIDNCNLYRQEGGIQGLFMRSEGVDPSAEQWGTLALATTTPCGVSYRTAWLKGGWGSPLLDFWDDFSADGAVDERERAGENAPTGSLAVQLDLPPGETRAVMFLLTWHFPNRSTWTPGEAGACCTSNQIGNYYTTQYADAWDVAERVAAGLEDLEARTLRFVRAFCGSDLPAVVKEAALFNLSTLRTQTCFRTPDGRFFGWEGCCDQRGCCYGSCTHVWNYEQATAFLFGDLARTMREVEFLYATDEQGVMSFRVNLPLDHARQFGKAAADGQMGCVIKLYRDWQLCGDDAWLAQLWPQAKKALAFCWVPGGWDADRDGVMEGCQHNTMDVEYYGPNPQMGAWYLGALRAAEEMARHLGDVAFADECRDLYERGSRWIDAHLFNGEYYEHQVRPPRDAGEIAPALRVGMGASELSEPDYQLAAGCLVDQLVGQCAAHVCGLGYLLDPAHVATTLQSIFTYNHRSDLYDHFNCMRSFALGDEAALLMAAYPKGRPRNPFPYFTEVMTGFEYAAAIGMLYEGQTETGLRCIADIRARYDGQKRNPFDEAECGHHYARAMISWAAVLAWTGFQWSAVTGTMRFAAREGKWFWSNGSAWGTCTQRTTAEGVSVTLEVLHGSLTCRQFEVAGVGTAAPETAVTLREGERVSWPIGRAKEASIG